ncbi:hypothetical protein ACLB2K_063637 [Fragaria x ananassa]
MFYEPHSVLREDSKTWAGVYVGIDCFGMVVVPVQNFLFGVAGGKLIAKIRSLTFQKVVHQQISWFDDPANSSGAIGARLSSDASTVKALVGDGLALITQNIATIIAGLVIGFTANWKLALLILGVSPLLIIQGLLQTKFLKGFSGEAMVSRIFPHKLFDLQIEIVANVVNINRMQAMYEEASQVANDAIGSIRTVASFCSEKKVMDAYEKKCEGPMKQGVRLGVVSGVGMLTILCCVILKQRAEAEDNKKKEKKEKNEAAQTLETSIIVSGVIVALIGAIFALTKKLREK